MFFWNYCSLFSQTMWVGHYGFQMYLVVVFKTIKYIPEQPNTFLKKNNKYIGCSNAFGCYLSKNLNTLWWVSAGLQGKLLFIYAYVHSTCMKALMLLDNVMNAAMLQNCWTKHINYNHMTNLPSSQEIIVLKCVLFQGVGQFMFLIHIAVRNKLSCF